MNKFSLQVPLNSVSFGQVSAAICREIYRAGLSPCIFPIGGQVDLSSQKEDADFNLWLQSSINKGVRHHNRKDPVFKLWHLNTSLESYSKNQALYFFHETDAATDDEINVINNQEVCFVSSKYTQQVFEESGARNIIYVPPGFDEHNFYRTDKIYLNEDIITFCLIGKWEIRKQTERILKLWIKRYGNNRKYQLNCLINNPFLDANTNQALINQALEGKRVWNINFFPWLRTNAEVNDLLNASDINLGGLSLLEGFNLPLFNSLCLGKWATVLDEHVHKDYCNDKNSFLVPATSKIPASDGLFFFPSQRFNQGNWFQFKDEDALLAMERAVTKAKERNLEGEKLKTVFSYSRMAEKILEKLQLIA